MAVDMSIVMIGQRPEAERYRARQRLSARRRAGWQRLTGENVEERGPSFDEFKGVPMIVKENYGESEVN